MAAPFETTNRVTVFGVIQGATLGILILLGVLLAMLLQNATFAGGSAPTGIGIMLWLLELGCYAGLAYSIARQPLVTVGGVLFGTLIRFVLCFLFALVSVCALIRRSPPNPR